MDDTGFLFRLIEDRLDMDEVLDLTGIGIGELCLRLRGNILDNREKFESYLDIYDPAEFNEETYGEGYDDE